MATSFVSSSMAATSTGDSTGGSGGGTSTYQRPSLWASNMSLNARSPPQGSAGADNNANGNGPTPPSRNNIPMSRRITTTNITQRAYLADQKQPFAHLQTKSLLLSTVKVCVTQAGSVITGVLGEQLEEETKRMELVEQKKLTWQDAEEEADAWEKREWNKNLKAFPKRCGVALMRFHASTLVIRFYEHVALYHSGLSISTVDMLTKDTHASARRKAERAADRANASSKGNTTNTTKNNAKMVAAKQMFMTSLYANAIGCLADATVQECILVWGYSTYYYHHIRKQRIARHNICQQAKQQQSEPYDLELLLDDTDMDDKLSSALSSSTTSAGGIFLSFLVKSMSIFVSRGMAWVASGAGSVVGTCLLPGWGTVVGAQMGDNLAGALFDQYHALSSSYYKDTDTSSDTSSDTNTSSE
jgi:hypothetical protein